MASLEQNVQSMLGELAWASVVNKTQVESLQGQVVSLQGAAKALQEQVAALTPKDVPADEAEHAPE